MMLSENACRVGGLVMAGCAGVAGVLAVRPANGIDWLRVSSPVVPLMLVPLVVAVIAAGLLVAVRPRWTSWCAPAVVVAAVQVAGMAVVAARDWYSFAGADGTSWENARAAARLDSGIAVAAAGAAALGVVLLCGRTDPRRLVGAYRSRLVWLGVAVALGLPFVLNVWVGYGSASGLGQFALWWSLPWGSALAGAGIAGSRGGRRSAWLGLGYSLVLTLACVAAPLWHAAPLRLPG